MRVLITGCSSGFGRCAAIELAQRGHAVVATARRMETLADLNVAQKLPLDVDREESVRAAVAQAGEIDALVNNAGWSANGPIEKVPLEDVRRMFETNFFGAARMIQAIVLLPEVSLSFGSPYPSGWRRSLRKASLLQSFP